MGRRVELYEKVLLQKVCLPYRAGVRQVHVLLAQGALGLGRKRDDSNPGGHYMTPQDHCDTCSCEYADECEAYCTCDECGCGDV